MSTSDITRRLTGLVRRMFEAPGGGQKSAATTTGDRPSADYRPAAADPVAVIGPVNRWGEVSPEGPLEFDHSGPAVTVPASGSLTGPSPRLRCQFLGEDTGEPVDIVVEARTNRGRVYFRLKLGRARVVDLAMLGVTLPPGDVHLWAVHRRTLDGKWVTACRTDLRIEPDWSDAAKLIAVVQPPPDPPEGKAAVPAAPAEWIGDQRQIHLAVWASDIAKASGSAADPKFMFGPLSEPVDLLLVRCYVGAVFVNAFTAAWLGTLLAERETAAALIERDDNGMAERLCKILSAAAVHRDNARWIRLDRTDDLADCVASLPTSYPFLHRAYEGFREKFSEKGWEGVASRSFMYSMLGTTRNSLLLEQMATQLGWGRNPTLVDIGGGCGFLGLELAAKGWNVAAIDRDPFRVEVIGRWLAGRSPRPLPLELLTQSMDEIPEGGVPGGPAPHAITFFHSLLMAQRDRVGDILRACWDALSPGGALVIHELVHGTPGERANDQRLFEQEELLRLITENAAAPSFLSVLDGKPMTEFVPGTSLILARRPLAANRRT
ncbi:MAG: class I SAM-dependent methyltransferase [Alphaproteobacteria bacterium]